MSESPIFGLGARQPQPRPAAECESLDEIRAAIDSVDRVLLSTLRSRLDYVQAAAAFRRDAGEVRAPERVAAMLSQRRAWAEQLDLDADWVEELYRFLVNSFIRMEMRELDSEAGLAGES